MLRKCQTSDTIYFLLPTLVKNGPTFEGRPAGIVVKLKSERLVLFPLTRNLCRLYDYWVDCRTREETFTVLA